MRLTDKEIKMLAETERMMDAGETPFVISSGGRMTVDPAAMKHFGLKSGQNVTNEIACAIVRFRLEQCQAAIAQRQRPN